MGGESKGSSPGFLAESSSVGEAALRGAMIKNAGKFENNVTNIIM